MEKKDYVIFMYIFTFLECLAACILGGCILVTILFYCNDIIGDSEIMALLSIFIILLSAPFFEYIFLIIPTSIIVLVISLLVRRKLKLIIADITKDERIAIEKERLQKRKEEEEKLRIKMEEEAEFQRMQEERRLQREEKKRQNEERMKELRANLEKIQEGKK